MPMEDLVEILLTYLFMLLPWPSAFVQWVWESDAWAVLVVWLAIGLPATWLVNRFVGRRLRLLWIAVWFMPSTLICGSGTLVPWPMAFGSVIEEAIDAAVDTGGCITVVSLLMTLTFNLIFVFGGAAAFRWWLTRKLASKP
ncbi:MAG: hypothetical protein AB7V26_12525 [Lysobacterales bacterium]